MTLTPVTPPTDAIAQHIDKHGIKYICIILIIIVSIFLAKELHDGVGNENELIAQSIGISFSVFAVVSGVFSFLVAGFSHERIWPELLSGFRTYIAIGAFVEIITSTLFLLSQFEIINLS